MPQLRTFSAYTKNANAGVNLFARQCALSNIDGNYLTGAAGQYFQLHDKATAPVNADVPIKSFYLASAGPINLMSIFQILGPINFVNGLGVAISSTEATLTLGTGSFDVFGEIEEYEVPVSGLTTVGDLTTGINSLAVWIAANGPNKIYTVDVINATGIVIYLMMFPDGAVNGAIPIWTSPALPNSATAINTFSFGSGGEWVRQFAANGLLTQGCYFYSSSTAGTLAVDASGGMKIRAKYKNS